MFTQKQNYYHLDWNSGKILVSFSFSTWNRNLSDHYSCHPPQYKYTDPKQKEDGHQRCLVLDGMVVHLLLSAGGKGGWMG